MRLRSAISAQWLSALDLRHPQTSGEDDVQSQLDRFDGPAGAAARGEVGAKGKPRPVRLRIFDFLSRSHAPMNPSVPLVFVPPSSGTLLDLSLRGR